MNKDEILKRVQKKEDKMLVSNILDKYLKYDKTGISTYTNFLDIRTLEIAENILKYLKVDYKVYKPNEVCEKSIIYFGDYESFITIYKIDIKDIKHSDVLGTLFSIGLDNDTIGDIIIEDDCIYITNLTRLNVFLESSLYVIKNRKVKLNETNEINASREKFITLKVTVPSYRLDVFIGKLAHLSRTAAAKYIIDKMVLVNYSETTNTNKILKIGDIISIRKVGKFILSEEILKSKKDNYVVEVKKYN